MYKINNSVKTFCLFCLMIFLTISCFSRNKSYITVCSPFNPFLQTFYEMLVRHDFRKSFRHDGVDSLTTSLIKENYFINQTLPINSYLLLKLTFFFGFSRQKIEIFFSTLITSATTWAARNSSDHDCFISEAFNIIF